MEIRNPGTRYMQRGLEKASEVFYKERIGGDGWIAGLGGCSRAVAYEKAA